MINIKIKFINKEMEQLSPSYATKGSAAVDLRASIDSDVFIERGECKLIKTGIAVFIDDNNYAGLILPRSGLGHNHGLILGNGTGLIDSDYQGEIMVSCYNRSNIEICITPKMRFAQLVFVPVAKVKFDVVEDFDNSSDRGEKGFGHSGFC